MGVFEDFQKKAISSATGTMGRWYSTTIFFAFLSFISNNLDPLVSPYLIYFFSGMLVLSSLSAFWQTTKPADRPILEAEKSERIPSPSLTEGGEQVDLIPEASSKGRSE